MRSRRHAAARPTGFTLIELVVVIAIVGILAALAGSYWSRSKPRASLADAALELQVLLHQARQTALADGKPVAVLVYPSYTPPSGSDRASRGYFIVYEDACYDFFTGGATCGVAYSTYDPSAPKFGGGPLGTSVVIDTMPLPSGVVVGPATGMGASATLAAPLDHVNVRMACSFCGSTGGAVQFDARGQATFYGLSGSSVTPLSISTTPAVNGGASISLGYDANVTDATGQRTLVILSGSGAVEVLNNG